MLGSGRAHVAEICDLARSNLQDGLPSELASLGANGAHSSNQERDLHRWLVGIFGMKLTTYNVPIKLTVPAPSPRNLFVWSHHFLQANPTNLLAGCFFGRYMFAVLFPNQTLADSDRLLRLLGKLSLS